MNRLLFYPILIFLSASCTQAVKKPSNRSVVLTAFSDFDTLLLQYLSKEVNQFFGCRVSTSLEGRLPASAFLLHRKRYRADSLLRFLSKHKPANTDHILGLTGSDISVSIHQNNDWGVFGFGQCPGPAAVVSTFRLKREQKNETAFKNRLKNVVLHELGHNFGLPHCPDKTCLMKDAKGKLSSVEGGNRLLCTSCMSKIQSGT